MLRRLFKKKKAAGPGTPARALAQSEDLVDQDETIVIDLTSDAHLSPEDIRLQFDGPAPAAPAPVGTAEAESTEIWTGQGAGRSLARDTAGAHQADKAAATALTTSATDTADGRLVVGWLVVTSANGRGVSYPVRLGRNKLGRGEANAISVRLGDSTISSDGHLTIAADPRSKRFYAIPGESTNLAYLNETPLLEAREITDKCVLQAGDTVFVFVQFAGNYVDWD
jgi:hypothetical protein